MEGGGGKGCGHFAPALNKGETGLGKLLGALGRSLGASCVPFNLCCAFSAASRLLLLCFPFGMSCASAISSACFAVGAVLEISWALLGCILGGTSALLGSSWAPLEVVVGRQGEVMPPMLAESFQSHTRTGARPRLRTEPLTTQSCREVPTRETMILHTLLGRSWGDLRAILGPHLGFKKQVSYWKTQYSVSIGVLSTRYDARGVLDRTWVASDTQRPPSRTLWGLKLG